MPSDGAAAMTSTTAARAHHDALSIYERVADHLEEVEYAARCGWWDADHAASARTEHDAAWRSFVSTMERTMTLADIRAARDAANAEFDRVSANPASSQGAIRKARKVAREAHDRWLDAATSALSGGAYDRHVD